MDRTIDLATVNKSMCLIPDAVKSWDFLTVHLQHFKPISNIKSTLYNNKIQLTTHNTVHPSIGCWKASIGQQLAIERFDSVGRISLYKLLTPEHLQPNIRQTMAMIPPNMFQK